MNDKLKTLCLNLLRSNTEKEVITHLTEAGYWNDPDAWQLYGGVEGNWSQIGNQQSSPEAALVEKIINSVDSRIMRACSLANIDYDSEEAPDSVPEAVTRFFGDGTNEGRLVNWPSDKRNKEARNITVAVTGGRRVHENRMCLTVVDLGEGQSPSRLSKTILSLSGKNKQRIKFVQGKFNMGGAGALRFCGEGGLQLVISKRCPQILTKDNISTLDLEWGFTIVREETRDTAVHSEYTYLAPGGVPLSFPCDELPLMPIANKPYTRAISWGTAIKLYEYPTTGSHSNILMRDGLLYSLERLLPEIALPVRLHECRYHGGNEASFDTTLAGLVVRLETGKGQNLEAGFPLSIPLNLDNIALTVKIYAFRENQARTYLKDEGVIFMMNGQAHGNIPKSIFTRPTKVGLSRLRDSLLLLVNCSNLPVKERQNLFMSSRDRLTKHKLRKDIETKIEKLLKDNDALKRLQHERSLIDIEKKLKEDKPLEVVLKQILDSSPSLQTLFNLGKRFSGSFDNAGNIKGNKRGSNIDKPQDPFIGAKYPTYFRFFKQKDNFRLERKCEIDRDLRIKFETDVENEYFDRNLDKGKSTLHIKLNEIPTQCNWYLSPDSGVVTLHMELPKGTNVNDNIEFTLLVEDRTLNSFSNTAILHVQDKAERKSSNQKNDKIRDGSGQGDIFSTIGLSLPEVVSVRKNDVNWNRYNFTDYTACHVESDPSNENLNFTFYINLDNLSLSYERINNKPHSQLIEAKFKYGLILICLSLLHTNLNQKNTNNDDQDEDIFEQIQKFTASVTPILIPMIDNLSSLSDTELFEIGITGEDG